MKMTDLAVILNYSTSVWGASKTDQAVSKEVLLSKNAEDKAGKFTKHLLGGDLSRVGSDPLARSSVSNLASYYHFPFLNDGAGLVYRPQYEIDGNLPRVPPLRNPVQYTRAKVY